MAMYGLQANVAQPVVTILVITRTVQVVNHVLQQWPCHPIKEEVNERRNEKNKYKLAYKRRSASS